MLSRLLVCGVVLLTGACGAPDSVAFDEERGGSHQAAGGDGSTDPNAAAGNDQMGDGDAGKAAAGGTGQTTGGTGSAAEAGRGGAASGSGGSGGSGGASAGTGGAAGGQTVGDGAGTAGAAQAGTGGGPDELEPKPLEGCPGYVTVFVPKGTCVWFHGTFTVATNSCSVNPTEGKCGTASAVSADTTSIVSTSAEITRFDLDVTGCPKKCN